MKIAALDVGDVWTGSAISDPLGILARPFKTAKTKEINTLIAELTKQLVSTFIVGHPKTMRGTTSEQTEKVETQFNKLKTQYPNIKWILWDERLSSKRAQTTKHARSKKEKVDSHSIAAAFILESYLSYQHFIKNSEE